jgi:hypothetical protein
VHGDANDSHDISRKRRPANAAPRAIAEVRRADHVYAARARNDGAIDDTIARAPGCAVCCDADDLCE